MIQAHRWDGDKAALWDWAERSSDGVGDHAPTKLIYTMGPSNVAELHIETLEGRMHVTLGDYVICGLKGEFYPCKPDIFHMKYESMEL